MVLCGAQLLQERLCRLIKERRLPLIADLHNRDVGETGVEEWLHRFHDRIKIRTAWDLLGNVFRHTPEGTPVTVIAGRDNGTAELVVADKGPGVAPASHTQVFERFYTADAARGSGLGLAIAKELAERMDGRITLNSRPGRTVFKLALPIAADDSPDRPE